MLEGEGCGACNSIENSKKRKPTVKIKVCFTYLCVKTTGWRRILFSKDITLSMSPTKKVNRLDKIFPFRRRAGKTTFLTIWYVKTKMSINSKMILYTIFRA